jgi:DNA processing protein
MDKTELNAALARCSFLSCREKAILSKNLDNLESLTVLSIEDICRLIGRSIRTASGFPENLGDLARRDADIMEKMGIGFVTYPSPLFPPLLREIPDPPFSLYWRGTLPNPERPLIGIVGTRMPSGAGAQAADRIAGEFARAGIAVVSGLARGIDAFAHRGCVSSGGVSIAVLASGVDRVYPRSNARLASRVVESGGCLMGEYPPGAEPLKYHFPQRNRIISGLSRAVLVVEAPEKSGALITADFALEQGRDLFVCRATLESARGAGCAALNGDGAPAIDSAEDILDAWGFPSDCGKTAVCGSDDSVCGRETIAGSSVTARNGDGAMSRSVQAGRQLALDFRMEMRLP